VTRTTTTGYDGRDRPVTVATILTGLADSEPVPTVTTSYDDATGQTTATTSAAGLTGFGYDAWGRQTSYHSQPTGQATADVTTTVYNNLGQVTEVSDPNGTTTYTWDGTDANGNTETRGLTTAVTITTGTRSWTSTGAYDAHGTLVRENLPGGIVKRSAYDVNGELVELRYNGQVTDPDTSDVSQDQPWIAWSLLPNTSGQTAHEWTPDGAAFTGDLTGTTAITSDRHYRYDPAGRLTTVTDQTGTDTTTCTLRTYGSTPTATGPHRARPPPSRTPTARLARPQPSPGPTTRPTGPSPEPTAKAPTPTTRSGAN
jgi:YD repeat-containing protein